jgi:hypothetical protein
MVTRESAPVLAASVLLVLGTMWLTLGRLSAALTAWPDGALRPRAAGAAPLLGLELNFLNVVAVPASSHDGGRRGAPAEPAARARRGRRGGVRARVLGETGRAVGGGLLTSAIGFAALVFADHPGSRRWASSPSWASPSTPR